MNEDSRESGTMSTVLDIAALAGIAFGGYKGYKYLTGGSGKKAAKEVAENLEKKATKTAEDVKIETTPPVEKPVVAPEPTPQEVATAKSDTDITTKREELLKNDNGEYMQSRLDYKNKFFYNENVDMTSKELEQYGSVYDNIRKDITDFNEYFGGIDEGKKKNTDFIEKMLNKNKDFYDTKDRHGFKDAHNLLFDTVDATDSVGAYIDKIGHSEAKEKFTELNNKIDEHLKGLSIERVKVNKGDDVTKNIDDLYKDFGVSYANGEGDILKVDDVLKNAYRKEGQGIRDGSLGINKSSEKFTPEQKTQKFEDNFKPEK